MEKQYQSRVEEAVDLRRRALRLTWRMLGTRSGVSHETLRRLRAGDPVSDVTEAGVEQALHWDPGSIQLIRMGMSPITMEEVEQVEQWRRQGEFDDMRPTKNIRRPLAPSSETETKFSEFLEARDNQRAQLLEQGKVTTMIQIMGPEGSAFAEVVHDAGGPPSPEDIFRGFLKVFEEFNKQAARNQELRDGHTPPPLRPRSPQDRNS